MSAALPAAAAMDALPPVRWTAMRDLGPRELRRRLANAGIALDYGSCIVRVRSDLEPFADALATVYAAFPVPDDAPFADLDVEVLRGEGLRSHVRPQSRFRLDDAEPFEPFPAGAALPHFEWGVNWSFARRFNQYVLLHAATLELDGRAVILAATPGSGKSTLCAALMLAGFRLLSDEFGVLDPADGSLRAMLKPVALKNASIGVIRARSRAAALGPTFGGTRKGDVAHLAPDAASVAARHVAARPAVVAFPRFAAGAPLKVTQQPAELAFARLAFNSFNYAVLGRTGFDAVADTVERTVACEIEYGDLDDAIGALRAMLAEAP